MHETNKHRINIAVFVSDLVQQNRQINIFRRALFVIAVIIYEPCYPFDKCTCNIDAAVGPVCLTYTKQKYTY